MLDQDQSRIEALSQSEEIAALDISAFDESDVLNLVLQRSDVLWGVDGAGRIIRAWSRGDKTPLETIVADMGDELMRRGLAILRAEYEIMRPVLARLKPSHIADIGCGYAFFDLFAAQDFGCRLTLIDLEQNDARHFGFQETGAAYSNLDKARQFLVDNGVAGDDIVTLNPGEEDANAVDGVDLAVSFLSCGFHYPLSTYAQFWRSSVVQDGAILVDLRAAQVENQMSDLVELGETSALWRNKNSLRVLCRKPVFAESQ